MRYISAQLEAYLHDELWLRLAAKANSHARVLAEGLAGLSEAELLYPVQSNEVFVRLSATLADGLRGAGFEFHPWPHAGPGAFRLVTSFATPDDAVARLLALAREISDGVALIAER